LPVRSDIELAVGRAYQAMSQDDKATVAFRNVCTTCPSVEADAAGAELLKLKISGSLAERRTRADLLFKARHYSDAATEYDLLRSEWPRRTGRLCNSHFATRCLRVTAAVMPGRF
jgi:hypothetical protein